MNFRVDHELCIGCSACEETCPAVFKLADGKSNVILDPVTEAHQKDALLAEDGCPVSAISHA